MSDMDYIFDGTVDNFRQLVIDNSAKGLVLVNYWKPGVGPCLKLWQALEQLAKEYHGRFLLVNINTEKQRQLVSEHGITSVPIVKFYRNGKIGYTLHGAHSANSIRKDIDKYFLPLQDPDVIQAIKLLQAGNAHNAIKHLQAALALKPDLTLLHTTLLKILLRERRFAEMEVHVEALPLHQQVEPEISYFYLHGKLFHLAEQAQPVDELDEYLSNNPQDLNAALSRAAIAVRENDIEFALEYLFYVLDQDKDFRDEFARKAMLALFADLGPKHELTRKFQQRMRSRLH